MSQQGLPKSTIVVAGVAIALAGLATFVVLKWSDSRTAAGELTTRIAEVDAEAAGVRDELESVEGELSGVEQRTSVLKRGKLQICHSSGAPVVVEKGAATWMDDEGEYRTFNSTEHGQDLWRVEPGGERLALEHPASGWDGAVSYYAVWLRVNGDQFPFAGPWPPPGGDDCLRWAWGGS